MNKIAILNFLRENKEEMFKNYGVVKIGLFGSYVKERERDDSDVDIAVEIESKNKFRSFFSLKYYLEENLKKSVDLGIESTLKPAVKESIEREIIYV